jgi:hypothetical protein
VVSNLFYGIAKLFNISMKDMNACVYIFCTSDKKKLDKKKAIEKLSADRSSPRSQRSSSSTHRTTRSNSSSSVQRTEMSINNDEITRGSKSSSSSSRLNRTGILETKGIIG